MMPVDVELPIAVYDAVAEEYAARLAGPLAPHSLAGIAVQHLLTVVGPCAAQDVCDLACGEGHLSRHLAAHGARVTGVDLSARLLAIARCRTPHPAVRYVRDDAQQLAALPDACFDLVVSHLALMDIPDLGATYRAVHRVVRPGGRFVFAITHPCFQAPGTTVEREASGPGVARRVARYADEGFWRSPDPQGLRGKVGAYHRTLATYLNGLIAAQFVITRVDEPTLRSCVAPP